MVVLLTNLFIHYWWLIRLESLKKFPTAPLNKVDATLGILERDRALLTLRMSSLHVFSKATLERSKGTKCVYSFSSTQVLKSSFFPQYSREKNDHCTCCLHYCCENEYQRTQAYHYNYGFEESGRSNFFR